MIFLMWYVLIHAQSRFINEFLKHKTVNKNIGSITIENASVKWRLTTT